MIYAPSKRRTALLLAMTLIGACGVLRPAIGQSDADALSTQRDMASDFL